MKKALITGVTGQDGSYLSEFLLSKGYEVHGILRRSSSFNTHRLDGIYHDPHESGVTFRMHYGDLSDSGSLINLIRNLEAIRASGVQTRFYQAASSEMFGAAPPPQNERTPFHPRSPYGVSKLFG